MAAKSARGFLGLVRKRGVIEELDEDTVWVLEVKGAGSVSVGFYGVNQRDTQRGDSRRNDIHVLRTTDDKPDVMNTLNTRLGAVRKLMNGKIVASGSQINIIRIGLPFDPHTENFAVKIDGYADVLNIKCDMPEA